MSQQEATFRPIEMAFEANAQLWREAADLVDTTANLPDASQRMAAVDVGETPSEVIYRENKLTLHRYDPPDGPAYDVPILVVYALINRPYILDLQPDRSVIKHLRDAGFTVYMIDWGEPSRLDTTLGLDDYVNRYIDNCVEAVRDDAAVEDVNILGYCMGGTLSAMYAALFPQKVNALGLMAAGLCFDDTGGQLERWGDEAHFDPEVVVDTYGNVPSDFLDIGFALMDPVDNFVTKYTSLIDNLENDDFVENFARMETWLGDGIDVAGRAYVEFLRWFYQENRLMDGTVELNGRTVDLANIDMPVLQLVGEYDHLIPPESSLPFTDAVGSTETETIQAATGHIGLSVSSRSHEQVWPNVVEWYAEYDDQPELEDVSGVGPAYAERLRAAGIESIEDLADAEVDDLADSVDIPPTRLQSIIEAAADR